MGANIQAEGAGKVLFVLADGARARFVERAAGRDSFVTADEIDGRAALRRLRDELRRSPPVRSFESASPRRHSVGREDFFRQAKEAFVEEVAARAGRHLDRRGLDQVFVAAPGRLLGLLERRLGAKARLAGTLERDLTKTPDSALAKWLS